ncbi:hypothetical protein DPEC_G00119080 [Dallia pectoralis]|uniref:Uncharacterized protein n=1 Tax=Dallia pectoralis TaxID=75939 RepID=A0ACC2GPQ6_DALPE|nr:hypothetical protein DPEC_G00119080 [Dallia pectoralis]
MIIIKFLCFLVFTILHLYLQAGDCAEIVGGQEVEPHSVPYIALLEDKNDMGCGGMLINKKWVLTAAHCLGWGFPWQTDIQMVHLGVHSLKKATRSSIQSIQVMKNIPHPDYDATTHQHDIMLLQLKKAVKESNTVRVKPLPNPLKDIQAGTKCFVAGWGLTSEKGSASDVLLNVSVTVIDRKVCNKSYGGEITNGMFCAGSVTDQPADACQGDSGGPLVCGGELRGVVSHGKGCGHKDYPGVYTFISKYDDWIKKTIGTAE